MNTSKHKLDIFKILEGLTSLKEVEKWAYAEDELETYLGSNRYLDLISINFNSNGAIYDIHSVLKNCIDEGEYLTWSLKRVLEAIINVSEDVHLHIETTYDMYCKGYDFLRKVGLNYGLSVAFPPPNYNSWDDLSDQKKTRLIESFYPEISKDVSLILDCLNDQSLQIKGWKDNILEYDDSRSIKMKKTMALKVVNLDNFLPRTLWRLFRIPIYKSDI